MAKIERVGVVGCGLMGSGIAQVCAQAGFRTMVREVSPDRLEGGLRSISKRLERLEDKEKINAAEREAALARIDGTTELADLAECDMVIEAVVEDLEVKNALWRELEAICSPEAIFASNTSSLTITEMAATTGGRGRLIGLHFFNPVPVMQLVEVVGTIETNHSVLESATDFVRRLGKEPIACRDASGFVVNRLLVPYMMDAIRMLEQGVASAEDIDKGMQLGAGHPMGPLALCDFVGNDTLARIGDIMYEEYRERRYAAPPLLKRMVSLGRLGRKSGRGFYEYPEDGG
ncbi:MAG: 3-hydroxybutyryl-CoA dehydrogenase [Gemmatimonadota bacterium]